MAVLKGYLSLLGNHTVDLKSGGRKYSVVNIGDHEICNVHVTEYMDNYLHKALGGDAELVLASLGFSRSIVAVRHQGKVYSEPKMMLLGLILLLVIGLPMVYTVTFSLGWIPVWGMGLLLLWMAFKMWAALQEIALMKRF